MKGVIGILGMRMKFKSVFPEITDSQVSVWVIAGTDSCFEGPTMVNYANIIITFSDE